MKIFRADGQPSRDDECEHGFRRFEKCAHCLEADNARLREALQKISRMKTVPDDKLNTFTLVMAHTVARAALGEKE